MTAPHSEHISRIVDAYLCQAFTRLILLFLHETAQTLSHVCHDILARDLHSNLKSARLQET